MKKLITITALVLASGSCFASGFADGNADLDDWVVSNPPKSTSNTATTSNVIATSNDIFNNNPDLNGWVVHDLSNQETPTTATAAATAPHKSYAFSKGNPDLFEWVVNDVQHG
ncbi:MAG: hypothetical protein U1B30_13400 [Pseudomonadota bacterium]|nr:hypothetical protein [Pseudomonadota bacterium]